MKLWNKVGAYLLAGLILSPLSFAHQPEERNVSDQFVANRTRGVGVGSATPSIMQHWVQESLHRFLHRAQIAAGQEYAKNRPGNGFGIMMEGLRRAEEAAAGRFGYNATGPMTRTLIRRASAVGARIAEARGTNRQMPDGTIMLVDEKVKYAILSEWITLIIDVAENFDVQFYIPYHQRFGRCSRGIDPCQRNGEVFDYRAFELRLVKLAGKQLELMNNKFSLQQDNNRIPFGTPQAYTIVMREIAGKIVDDLVGNLYQYAYHRPLVQLHNLAWHLRHRTGHQDPFHEFSYALSQSEEVKTGLFAENFVHCDSGCASSQGWVTPRPGQVGGPNAPGFVHPSPPPAKPGHGGGQREDRDGFVSP